MSGVKIKPKELKPDPDLVSTPREERKEIAKTGLSKLPKPDPSLVSKPREGT